LNFWQAQTSELEELRGVDAVAEYEEHPRLLFQITDDLFDVTATTETLGKTRRRRALEESKTLRPFYTDGIMVTGFIRISRYANLAETGVRG
jgi:hypothetical protein